MKLKAPEEYGYVVKDGFCLFQKGPLSQWWGAYKGQESPFRSNILGTEMGPYYNCAEQFMMAMKASIMRDEETLKLILAEKNPAKHKDLGRQIKNFNGELWNQVKFAVVALGNFNKFSQNPELKEFLLAFPEDTIFAEAAPWDKIWGIGLGPEDPRSLNVSTWQGENLLGQVHNFTYSALLSGKPFEVAFAEYHSNAS